MMKTLFISLPMHGKSKKEIEQRLLDISRVAIHLACKKFGWKEDEVWWVSAVDNQIDKNSSVKNERILYLGEAIKTLANVDAVYFDKGWTYAKGCCVERFVALKYDIPRVYWNENLGGKTDEEKEE